MTFTVGGRPTSGFYVQQTDNSGNASVYVGSNVRRWRDASGLDAQISAVPEPGMVGSSAGGRACCSGSCGAAASA